MSVSLAFAVLAVWVPPPALRAGLGFWALRISLSRVSENSGVVGEHPGAKFRHCCFTINLPGEPSLEEAQWYSAQLERNLREHKPPFKGFIFQLERKQHVHLQGYATCSREMVFNTWRVSLRLRRREGTGFVWAHLEKAKGTLDDNIRYCSKMDSRIAPPVVSDISFLTQPKQGKRNDLGEANAMIQSGAKMRDLAMAKPELWIKFHKGLESIYYLTCEARKPGPVYAIFLRGETGLGKTEGTRMYFEEVLGLERDEYYWWSNKHGKNWWDNYDRQDHVLIDELDKGHIDINDMLRIFEPNGAPVDVPIHGGRRQLQAHFFIIASNRTLDQIVGDDCDAARKAAIRRRITEVNVDCEAVRGHKPGLCNLSEVDDGICRCILMRGLQVRKLIERTHQRLIRERKGFAERKAEALEFYEQWARSQPVGEAPGSE